MTYQSQALADALLLLGSDGSISWADAVQASTPQQQLRNSAWKNSGSSKPVKLVAQRKEISQIWN